MAPIGNEKEIIKSPGFLNWSETFTEAFLSGVKGLEVDSDSESKTEQIVSCLISGDCMIDEIKEEIKNQGIDKEKSTNLFILYADKIIQALEEDVAKKRMASRRATSAMVSQSRKEMQKDEKKKKSIRKRKQETEEESDITSIRKMSLEEIGNEIEARDAIEKEQREKREEEEKVLQDEQSRYNKAYQLAFRFYGEAILLSGNEDDNLDSLMKNVVKMGDKELTVRQMAVERMMDDANLSMAYYPLLAALKDKVIVHRVWDQRNSTYILKMQILKKY